MNKSNKAFIDRVEGDLAVVVLYDDDKVKFNLPRKYLPEGASEGDYLNITFAVDKESREAEKQKIDGLLKKLTGKKRDE
ncbi:MAG TPA: DUF3006 domain-containing protein [Blastocatellia bacterium]